mmetsp:Transcript_83782/g.261753  ORF Transcript_83782/g.261753 Transcript_83782/m.261753 type:complete len:550 (+) Transcript_83782:48-1697(+)
MGLSRQSGAPVRIRLKASFITSAVATVTLIVSCIIVEITSSGSNAERRRLSLYPRDAILTEPYNEDPNRWLVILHCIGIGYMLLGLNTVCDVYFTGALEVMVTEWNIKPDVAGATFMAAGGSAPEFFTSLIGTTWVISDVGFSTIVGSAVFNVLFVIGLCGWAAREEIPLTWWPLARDCTYYIFGLSLLAAFASDEKIGLIEAVILFLAYIVYCIIMYFNERLESIFHSKVRHLAKRVAPDDQPAPAKAKERTQIEPGENPAELTNCVVVAGPSTYGKQDQEKTPIERTSSVESSTMTGSSTNAGITPSAQTQTEVVAVSLNRGQSGVAEEEKLEPAEAEEDSDDGNIIDFPDDDSLVNKILWFFSLPVNVPVYFLLPKPHKGGNVFVATFLLSLVWIAGFAFLLVWWTHTLGQVLGVKDVIMNFTLLAMGTSIPDAASSVAVARNGEGDMAVSSSIGSNVFDILVGLPVPWIIKVLIEGVDYKVRIFSDFLTFYVLLLLAMVFCVIMSIHFLGWKLNKALGAAMALLYLVFLAVAITTEIERPEALMI